jgi:antitoxin ChpS
MLNASLRRSGGSLIMTIPAVWAEQNGLDAGSAIAVEVVGRALTLRAPQTRPSMEELLAQTPRGLQRAKAWDAMTPAGREL